MKTATKLEDNIVLLPDGEIVKVRKRYCDKRKDEKYISKRLKELNGISKKSKVIKRDKGIKVPIRLDCKTVAYVWEYLCYKEKWLVYIGTKEEMDDYISKIKSKELKLWQI